MSCKGIFWEQNCYCSYIEFIVTSPKCFCHILAINIKIKSKFEVQSTNNRYMPPSVATLASAVSCDVGEINKLAKQRRCITRVRFGPRSLLVIPFRKCLTSCIPRQQECQQEWVSQPAWWRTSSPTASPAASPRCSRTARWKGWPGGSGRWII